MPDIFISYSSKDRDQATALAELLWTEGLDVWIDKQALGGGQEWATKIAEAIRECKAFLLLLSPYSVQSPEVLRELSLASERKRRVVPIELGGITDLPVHFDYPLAGLHRI